MAIVISTPREPTSFPTICLACSIALPGRLLRLNPRLQGRQTRVCELMSAAAYEAYGAEGRGSLSVTWQAAAGIRLRTYILTHAGPHKRPVQCNMTGIADGVRPADTLSLVQVLSGLVSGQLSRRPQKGGIEHFGCHNLATADQPDFVRPVVGDGAMYRAEVVPQQNVVLGPDMGVTEFHLQLVREQKFQHLFAFAHRQLVDSH